MPAELTNALTRTLAILCFCTFGFARSVFGEEITSGDTLEISILEWNRELGSVQTWDTLSSDYSVSEGGMLSFPFVGDVIAVGLDTNTLAVSLSNLLLERLSLADVPAVRVRVTDRAPVLVHGFVRDAGPIPYRKGQTVRKVFVAAGAAPLSLTDNPSLELENISESLINLDQRHALLTARLARLQAEGAGQQELQFAPAPEGYVATSQDLEQFIFDLNHEQSARREKLLLDQIELLKNEIASLEVQGNSASDQLELARDQLRATDELAARGLAVNARRIDALSLVSTLETRMLTLQLAETEARQNLALAELDLVDVRSGSSVVQLVSAQDVQNQILILEAQRLTLASRAKLLAAVLEPDSVLEARLWRSGMDEPMVVGFDSPVMPGDVIEFRSLGQE